MKNNSIIAEICSLPKQLEQVKNKSIIQLLEELDVDRKNLKKSIEDIKSYLKDNSALIENWLVYSMNKRTTKGWYFNKENRNKYIVGYFSNNVRKKKELKYTDAANACAFFMYNELLEILIES